MNPNRVKNFALSAAQMRQSIYGRAVTFASGHCVKATVGPCTQRHRLEEGGFLPEVDTLVRIPRHLLEDDTPPAVGSTLTDSRTPTRLYIIEEVKDDPLNVEIVLGCRLEE